MTRRVRRGWGPASLFCVASAGNEERKRTKGRLVLAKKRTRGTRHSGRAKSIEGKGRSTAPSGTAPDAFVATDPGTADAPERDGIELTRGAALPAMQVAK